MYRIYVCSISSEPCRILKIFHAYAQLNDTIYRVKDFGHCLEVKVKLGGQKVTLQTLCQLHIS